MGRSTQVELRPLDPRRGTYQNVIDELCMDEQREERKIGHEVYRRRQREVMASKINAGWHQTPANQFSQYLKQNQVLDQLQPAMSLLYEMPVKPTDLYEFLGEFLDDGGQMLMKISLLNAELLFKQAEVNNLRSDPEYVKWKDRLDAYLQGQGQTAIRASFLLAHSQAQAELPENSTDRASIIPESLHSSLSQGQSFSWVPDEQFAKPPPGIFPARTSFVVQSPEPANRASISDNRKSMDPNSSQTQRPSLLIPWESFRVDSMDDGKPFMTLEDVKAIPFQERLSIFADAEESGLNIVCTPSQTILRIDQDYAEVEDRIQLEEIVGFIEDHKKVDPVGILFDFNIHNRDQEYIRRLLERPQQMVEQEELARLSRLKKMTVDPMKGTDFHEEDEGSDYSDSEFTTAKTDPFREASLLKDGFHVMAEMRQFEEEALMEQERGKLHSDNSSDESEVDPDREAEQSTEIILREFTELEAKSPHKKNRFLRVLKAPKLQISDCLEWSGNQVKAELKQMAKKLPRLIKGIKMAHMTRPIPPPLEDRRLFEINKQRNPEEAERKLMAIAEANKYNLALKFEALHILLHLKTNLTETLTNGKEQQQKRRLKRRNGRKNFGYTKIDVDPETERKEKAQKLISLFSHAQLDASEGVTDSKRKTKKKQRIHPYFIVDAPEENVQSEDAPEKGRKIGRQSKNRSRSRHRSSARSRSTKKGRRSRSIRRALKCARERAEVEQANMSMCLKTMSDFLFEIPLEEVKATQQWINSTFPEAVFRLNEPLPDRTSDDEFDDDDDENYAWLNDYYEAPGPETPKKRFDDELVIPREAMQRIHTCGNVHVHTPGSDCCAQGQCKPTKPKKTSLKLISEDKFAKKPANLPSVQSLTKIPNKQLYRQKDLRPSEAAKQYVIDSFAQPFQSEVLRSFNFSLLDSDFK